jgi:hypothetical protein
MSSRDKWEIRPVRARTAQIVACSALADRIAAAGIVRPINWDELGSSAKDAWEERMVRSLDRAERRAAALAERDENRA